jgi:hypothetical protein
METSDLLKKLYEEGKFMAAAIPKVVAAYGKKLIGEVASSDEEEFRKSQCENCPLFDGKTCSRESMLWESEDKINFELIPVSKVEARFSGFTLSKDSYGNTRVAFRDSKKYIRGCGCDQTGESAKWKFSFDEESLNLQDGTAPCPMGKWSIENFNNWKTKKQQNDELS